MKTAESNCPDCGCELCQCPDHIEDVRGRSMADAAVGPCDCDPHIEYCPSCAPYLHEPLKPAGEEDKATYKQIADNYTSPANCPRCAELELQNSILEKELSHHIVDTFNAVEQIAALEADLAAANERIEELSFDAAMANQAREIGNHFGLTYIQVWSDTSIASQVIDKMKEQQATIAQQAEQLAAAEKDAERLNFLDTLSQRVDPSIIKCNWLNSDMHFANGCVTLYLRNCVGRATFAGLEESVREAIDAAIAASREGKS